MVVKLYAALTSKKAHLHSGPNFGPSFFMKSLNFALFLLMSSSLLHAQAASTLGVSIRQLEGGRNAATLSPCPSTPNCVTSYAHKGQGATQQSFPFTSKGSVEVSRDTILRLLMEDQAELVQSTSNYIHATYTSRFFKFIDDVEFHFPNVNEVHFRSASRTGRYDFGVNRKRIETLRFRYDQQ